ncbi:HAMP domain-containing histidine kinase [Arthrobacter jiangjiafuii]|uniref:histidine kinase n=1 Tax=Arthrobacter jiangjiafuii TaxID=2817475 RepID=A0A975R2H9_9MICC|nr:HAMP domain-containing sensor histidine kinase [Arthrobacter jiangjiafuii]MBP3043041.1 HAMP domain-containing histidine kinase [Arthrobacter jiangjiafuii]QWC11556.1 HAMP domain-containing histidine kinase [Arthrobacter jiangjiafuii]
MSGFPRPRGSREEAELRRASLRLAALFTALMVGLLGLGGLLVYGIVATQTRQAAEQTLESAVRNDSPRDVPLDVFLAVYDDGRLAVSRDMPAGLPDEQALAEVARDGTSRRGTVSVGGRTYEVLTARRGPDVVQAAVDTNEAAEQLRRLAWSLVVSVLTAGILAGAVSAVAARAAMRPLAESLALQRRFVADASHELRTPLTLLSTRAQLLRRRLADPRGQESGSAADEAAKQEAAIKAADDVVTDTKVLTGILEDLLVAADPRQPASTETVNLTAVARGAVGLLQPEAERRGLALELEAPASDVTVRGGQAALQRIFTALGDNAMDYARTRVRVSVGRSGREAVIAVEDDGPGFPPGFSSHAFDRFASARDSESGTGNESAAAPRHYGLGLALVAEIAARYGGTVRAATASEGRGARLEVRLPLAGKQAQL